MQPHPHRTDWDTPPDGDFASYVERLTRTPSPPRAMAPTPAPARATRPGTRSAAPRPVSGAPATASNPLPALEGQALQRLALTMRAGLLGLFAVHAVAWLVFGWGSFILMALTAGAWWLVGRVLPLLLGPQAAVPPALKPLLDALRDAARQPPFPRK